MAVSGNQKTRIGASISAVGIKLTITAKAAGVADSLRRKYVGMLKNPNRIGRIG